MLLKDQLAEIANKAQRERQLLEAKQVNDAVGGADMGAVLDCIRFPGKLAEPIPTGFPVFDAQLDGGLMPGMTVLGAVSSLGKTTLLVQLASKFAAEGIHVLFYSLEQGALELAAKALSCRNYLEHNSVTPASHYFLAPKRKNMSGITQLNLEGDLASYDAEIAPYMHIVEPVGQPSARDIAAKTREAHAIAAEQDKKIVVFIDYLQMLGPIESRMTEKQAVEANLLELRQLTRDLQIPVVLISSLNRASYNSPITLESFKESGGIEYAADLLLGLQVEGIEGGAGRPSKPTKSSGGLMADSSLSGPQQLIYQAKRDPLRRLELKILKNRNGGLPKAHARFGFFPAASLFVDRDGQPDLYRHVEDTANHMSRQFASGKTQ